MTPRDNGLLQRLLQFAIIAAVGCLIVFASARAEPAATVEQRVLSALQAGDRVSLVDLLDEEVRTTAAGPRGTERSLQGRASALGFLDAWRAGAGRGFRVQVDVEETGARFITVIGSSTTGSSSPSSTPLRIEIENDRVIRIESTTSRPD